RRRRPARGATRRRLADGPPRHAGGARAPARALPEYAARARAAARRRDTADQGVLRGARGGDGHDGGSGVDRREVRRVPALGAGQGAAGRRELRRELRGPGARPVHSRRSGPRRRGDRALPGAAGRHHDDLSPAVAGHGPRESHAIDPPPRPQGLAEVPVELGQELHAGRINLTDRGRSPKAARAGFAKSGALSRDWYAHFPASRSRTTAMTPDPQSEGTVVLVLLAASACLL